MINSIPSDAKVYLNDELVGSTPYKHSDTKIIGSINFLKLEKHNYETVNTSFSRDEEVDIGAVIGGIFFFIPFLWTMKYKSLHTYELKPIVEQQTSPELQNRYTKSKAEQIREFKQLLDDGLITQKEYEDEKKRVLEEQ